MVKTGSSDSLPYSSRVDVGIFGRLFQNTASSYKYLFFLSLLNCLEKNRFQTPRILLKDILLEMLCLSWYPHRFLNSPSG